MSQPTIDGQITFIYVSDLSASADFYERLMGFKLWLDQGTCRIYRVIADAYIGICQTSAASKGRARQQPDNIILTIVTADVDGWYNWLREQGAALEHPPQTNDKYNIYHCFLRDPDGHLVEIQRFLHDTD
ncbi:MAG: VOC family protein [Anaerolineaceae bacterium]|nr:MAG: VOC family protein [Anaerolineaceae bacterium]